MYCIAALEQVLLTLASSDAQQVLSCEQAEPVPVPAPAPVLSPLSLALLELPHARKREMDANEIAVKRVERMFIEMDLH
jgi:hypothetical protein